MTIKQKTALKLVESGRTMGEVMIAAGYSPNTAKAPTKLTKSKGWKELVEKYLPDDKLLSKHDEALEASKQIGAQILIDKDGQVISKENEGMIEVPDHQTRLKAVELGYKIKGRFNEGTTLNIENMKLEVVQDAEETKQVAV